MIDSELREFVESGLSAVVGTRDAASSPEAVRSWGPRVLPDGEGIEIFIDRAAAPRTLANLRDNARIALTLTHPISHRSVQFKGRCLEIADPVAGDWPWIEEHRANFSAILQEIGYPAEFSRRLWSLQVVKVRFGVEQSFDQTPGPEAGRPL